MKEFLPLVSKPVRYLGHEVHSIKKDPSSLKLRFCLAFPDVYEVGMSHLGLQILYHIVNGLPSVSCERAFAPWVDMEKVLRGKGIPLSSLESSTPLREFDLLGFSLQYELSFTNVLNMLDLSGIPLLSEHRDDRFPLVLGGGPSAFNPAPVADFFDAIVIGDGEEVIVEICHLARQAKEAGLKREVLLKHLSQREGVYVPSLHPGDRKIRKRLLRDLDDGAFPCSPIVPYMKVVHDRLNVEIARGCKRGCRFCEAGFIHRPYRERSLHRIEEILTSSLKETGYEEVSLLSLSAGDHAMIGPLLSSLMDRYERKRVAVSFPSLRIEGVVGYLAEQVKRVRKTGFTIAPEAGTERLRRVINKQMDEEILLQAVSGLFSKGWKNLKLYFMMGLPTERDEDLNGIVDLARRLRGLAERQRIHPNLSMSVSTFVPKPHTPFQWEAQIPLEEMKEKLHRLKESIKKSHLQIKWQDPHLSFLEGAFSTGDRSLSRVLIEAHRLGCRFDGWSDQFQFHLWKEAFERSGVAMDRHTRAKAFETALPWSLVDTGIRPTFLWEERQRALREEAAPACRSESCCRCGVCDGKEIRVKESVSSEAGFQNEIAWRAPAKKRTKRKIRLTFTKTGDLRFISHLELAHLFHRAAKRADLPLCYSEGFHPMPRIIFAKALPVGVESLAEAVSVEIEGGGTPQEIKERLNRVLPAGIEMIEAREVPLLSSDATVPDRSVYWISLDHVLSQEDAAARMDEASAKTELVVHQERKGKRRSLDILPLIERMEIRGKASAPGSSSGWGVELVLRASWGKTAKPLEIVGALLGLEGEGLSRCEVMKIE